MLWGIGDGTEPGRQAHTGSGGLRYAAKILYEIMLAGFLCLTKPAFMRRPWRITPCPAVPGWAFLCFVGIISTASLFALPSLYVPAARGPHAVALFTFLSLCVLVILLRFPIGCCRGLALCVFVICVCFARSPPGSLWICSLFARFCSGLAQHHIECHHEAEAHHKCYGGAV